jgi:hypothetical protein
VAYGGSTYYLSAPTTGYIVADVVNSQYSFSYTCPYYSNTDAPGICFTAPCRDVTVSPGDLYALSGSVCKKCTPYYDIAGGDRVCTSCTAAGSYLMNGVCLQSGLTCNATYPNLNHYIATPWLTNCESSVPAGLMGFQGSNYQSCTMTPTATVAN